MSASNAGPPSQLAKTPLYDLHVALGARMVEFAGYLMPVQYPLGVLKEHQHTRNAAGLFDVSHMGQVALRPRSGQIGDAARALETLVPADVLGLKPFRQRYTYFTNDSGGILDDLMVAHCGDHLLLIVNAACKASDVEHLRRHLSNECDIELTSRSLLALQGPKAGDVLVRLAPETADMSFMEVRPVLLLGAQCLVIRSGYTGEDGFELSIPADSVRRVADALLACPEVAPIGLGARDSLRLEAGLPLYGSDIDATTTPVEAGLAWAIQKSRRDGGERAGGFPGAGVILSQISSGTARRRAGLRPSGRQPVRAGALLFASLEGGEPVGKVTSGGFGPTVNDAISMGYLPSDLAVVSTPIFADVRGKRIEATVTALPFVAHRYKRG